MGDTTIAAEGSAPDWGERWQGGFCAIGALGGLPVRGQAYAAHPPFEQALLLPPEAAEPRPPAGPDAVGRIELSFRLESRRVESPPSPNGDGGHAAVEAAWAAALGRAVVLTRSAATARAALLAAAGVEPGEPVGVPANATRPLVEALKEHGARPRFLPLDDRLGLAGDDPPARVWAQPSVGLLDPRPLPVAAFWVDQADTLPSLARPAVGDVALWGLHLSADPEQAGALLAFADPDLADRVAARVGAVDPPDGARAGAQLARLPGLAERQRLALAETRRGLDEAAGLELLTADGAGLGHGVALRVPEESDPPTFLAYVRGENTPIRWLPELRPLHYAALREMGDAWRASAATLAGWLIVPVGPDYTEEELRHAVLGVVKAADYLGVRWRLDPARAATYARAMEQRYGPDHDAYRPAFAHGPT